VQLVDARMNDVHPRPQHNTTQPSDHNGDRSNNEFTPVPTKGKLHKMLNAQDYPMPEVLG
jgi:hypothetical protein